MIFTVFCMKKLSCYLIVLCFGLLCQVVSANDNRPLSIEITETESDKIMLQWRVPPTVSIDNIPQFSLENCHSNRRNQFGASGKQYYTCSQGAGGAKLSVDYPQGSLMLATLIRVTWLSGETQTLSVSPGEAEILLPYPETSEGIAKQYFILGVEHIWVGYDHLLFIACLVVIAGRWKQMLITITGFTLAHSITLVVAALGWVSIPVTAVEAVIAFSIVFLATELVRNRRTTLTWRYPVTVSSTFGLLHGFGFAAVLQEIGLPQTELGVALLFFNLGVEVGQVAFVAVMLAGLFVITAAVRSVSSINDQSMTGVNWGLGNYQMLVGYVVGSMASYWLIERVFLI